MSKIILHIDLNAFFVRCEEIKNPSLINKPVAVGGDGRAGIVSTCSYKAREYGVHSGMPTFMAKELCKNLIIIKGDYKYYELMSKEFIHYIYQFTPLVEQASIDECFVDITESYKKYGNNNINEYLLKIQNGLYKKTKLMCSIGVAPTKFLAKMGSDYKKPMGITIIHKKDIPSIIFPLPIKDYYGIGSKSAPKLIELGIKTIGDFYQALKNDDPRILAKYGNMKDSFLAELEGRSSSSINLADFNPKSVSHTSTFLKDTNDKIFLNNFLIKICEQLTKEINEKRKLTKTIQLIYKNADCNTNFKTKLFSKTFKEPTNNFDFLKKEVSSLFYKTYDGTVLRMAGVAFQNLIDQKDAVIQIDLFDQSTQPNEKNNAKLIVSKLNSEANKDLFFSGNELYNKRRK